MKKILMGVLSVFVLTACGGASEARSAQNSNQQSEQTSKTTTVMKPIHLTKAEFLKKVVDYEGNPTEWKYLGEKPAIIDFYASWCGPCRGENPHVVEIYKEYHPKGLEIFGVSLDNNKEAWVKAIADDGLVWKHGSDLKGWQSAPAPFGTLPRK